MVNLEVEGARTFVAEGFLVHNCRCSFTGLSEDEAADAGIDDEGPKGQDAADGFGDRPSEDGTDWAPTMGDYAKPIRDVLEDAID